MTTTEIQRVPGRFTLPAGWPKLDIPDTETNLVADFRAADLNTSGRWTSAVGSAVLRASTGSGRLLPERITDARGHAAARFEKSYLTADVDWAGPMTVIAVLRPAAGAGRQRIISGANGAFRGLTREGTQMQAAFTELTVSIGETPNGMVTATAVRFDETSLNGRTLSGSWSGPQTYPAPGYPQQKMFGVGSNGNAQFAGGEPFYTGDIYRLMFWSRLLTDTDVASVFQTVSATHGL